MLIDWVKIRCQEAISIVSKAVIRLFMPRTKPYSETELAAATLEKCTFFLVASIINFSLNVADEKTKYYIFLLDIIAQLIDCFKGFR